MATGWKAKMSVSRGIERYLSCRIGLAEGTVNEASIVYWRRLAPRESRQMGRE